MSLFYAYRCRSCGRTRDSLRREDVQPCLCGGISRRDFRVNIQPGFTPHFNIATGQYVSSDKEFREALKRTAEDNTLQTGTEHSYEPVYPSELKNPDSVGVTSDESTEQTLRKRHDEFIERH